MDVPLVKVYYDTEGEVNCTCTISWGNLGEVIMLYNTFNIQDSMLIFFIWVYLY
jgi:hypothetical protein